MSLRILTYKRTHIGDPDSIGQFGINDCMGRVPVTFKRKQGLILLDQIRAVDKVRLVKKEGAVADKTLLDTLRTLQEVFAE